MSAPQFPPQGHIAEYIVFGDIGLLNFGAVASAATRQRRRGTGIVQGTVLLRGKPIQWKLRELHEIGGAYAPDPANDVLPPEPVVFNPPAPVPKTTAKAHRRTTASKHRVDPAIERADLAKLARKKNISDNTRTFCELRAGLQWRAEYPPLSVQLAQLKGAALNGLNRSLLPLGVQLMAKGKRKKEPPQLVPMKYLPSSAYAWRPKLPPLAQQVARLKGLARSMLNRGLAGYGLAVVEVKQVKRTPTKPGTAKRAVTKKPLIKK